MSPYSRLYDVVADFRYIALAHVQNALLTEFCKRRSLIAVLKLPMRR
jgi:hypothetical protein